MSLLGHLGKAVTGGALGFLTGGFAGAAIGAAKGFAGNPMITKNQGVQARINQTKQTAQMNFNASPVPLLSQPSTSTFSASPMVRAAVNPVMSRVVGMNPSMPGGSLVDTGGFSWSPQGPVGQLGFTPDPQMGASPPAIYRRFYTKSGQPRRLKRNGQPYAVPHMNPMNPRAARRAVRRIRGARKLLQRIERSLPRATTRRRAA